MYELAMSRFNRMKSIRSEHGACEESFNDTLKSFLPVPRVAPLAVLGLPWPPCDLFAL